MEERELQDSSFACLEGCGFCCTFPPEADRREQALLRSRLAPNPLLLTVAAGGRSSLALQGGCGACTLLERRACSAYDLRPRHCRYFPFHVHFGPTAEVYVNRTCRGVERAPGRDLRAAFRAQVLDVASADAWKEHEEDARSTYAEFQRRARRADAWGDPRPIVEAATRAGDAVFEDAWLDDALARAGEDLRAADLLRDVMAPFSDEDVTKRPFYLAPDLRWLTFEGEGKGLTLLEMDERGALTKLDELSPTPAVAPGLSEYLARLTQRGIFTGSVYAAVDDADYARTVEQAAWWRLAEVVADLRTRAGVLRAMGVSDDRLAHETERFYDSSFLDAETIGGML